MRFCVIRHPDVQALGTCPESALDTHRANGWRRISEWRASSDLFHLPEFAESTDDLDADASPAADEQTSIPEPEPTTANRKTTKEKTA